MLRNKFSWTHRVVRVSLAALLVSVLSVSSQAADESGLTEITVGHLPASKATLAHEFVSANETESKSNVELVGFGFLNDNDCDSGCDGGCDSGCDGGCDSCCTKKCRTLIPDWKPILKCRFFCPRERKVRPPMKIIDCLEKVFNCIPLHACGEPAPAGDCETCETCNSCDSCDSGCGCH